MKSLFLILAMMLSASSSVFASTLSEKDMLSIENFIRSEVEWSYDGSFLELNEKSILVSVTAQSTAQELRVSAVAEVETNFYGEMEAGQVECNILLEKKADAWRVNYFKSSCQCEAGLQCGEGNLYEE